MYLRVERVYESMVRMAKHPVASALKYSQGSRRDLAVVLGRLSTVKALRKHIASTKDVVLRDDLASLEGVLRELGHLEWVGITMKGRVAA
ncbi:hypothetical protein KIPB_012119, partial [Kipferlia bialata]|eukprot:g12119.t1